MNKSFYYLILILFLCSCANIIMPSGGEKDESAPILLKTFPKNKTLDFQEKKITFHFNENIQENRWNDFFYISPLLANNIKYKINNKVVTIFLNDTLKDNTTYSLNLNQCIKDVNEGNILKKLKYLFSTSSKTDTLNIQGQLISARTLEPKSNTWVFLHKEELADSLCLVSKPLYVAKSDEEGLFVFDNLNMEKYKIFSITGFDFVYHEGDEVGFINQLISSTNDSNLIIYMSDPLYVQKNNVNPDTVSKVDINSKLNGNIHIKSNLNTNIIVTLYKDDKLFRQAFFTKSPYTINDIQPGEYKVSLTIDQNNNQVWDTGDFNLRKQPEKIYHYNQPITIRENWDLEVKWSISEL